MELEPTKQEWDIVNGAGATKNKKYVITVGGTCVNHAQQSALNARSIFVLCAPLLTMRKQVCATSADSSGNINSFSLLKKKDKEANILKLFIFLFSSAYNRL